MPRLKPIAAEHIRDFQIAYQSLTRPAPLIGIEPFNNIMGMGAWYDSQSGLYFRDKAWLLIYSRLCPMLCLPQGLKPNFYAADLADGHDILDPTFTTPADTLVCHYVIDPDKRDRLIEKHPDWKHLADTKQQRFMTSEYHSPEAYREAARRLGTRMIIAFRSIRDETTIEVDGSNFAGDEFVQIRSAKVLAPKDHPKTYTHYRMDIVLREDLLAALRGQRLFTPA